MWHSAHGEVVAAMINTVGGRCRSAAYCGTDCYFCWAERVRPYVQFHHISCLLYSVGVVVPCCPMLSYIVPCCPILSILFMYSIVCMLILWMHTNNVYALLPNSLHTMHACTTIRPACWVTYLRGVYELCTYLFTYPLIRVGCRPERVRTLRELSALWRRLCSTSAGSRSTSRPHPSLRYASPWMYCLLCDYMWLCETACDCIRLNVTMCDCVWLCVTVCACVWLLRLTQCICAYK